MMVYPLLIIILASVLLLLAVHPSRTVYVRLLSFPSLCVVFVVCLVLFSDTAVKSALNGLNLWVSAVVPSLFPFFVASELISASGLAYLAGILLEPVMRPVFNVPGCSSLALALGMISGYPVGAKITSDLRKNNALTKTEAERLLAFTNNSGPIFITGAVGTGMLGSPSIGLFLLACHLLAGITVGLVFRFYKPSENKASANRHMPASAAEKSRKSSFDRSGKSVRINTKHIGAALKEMLVIHGNKRPDPGTLLGEAVRNSVSAVLSIGGFIVLFSVITGFLEETGFIRLTAAAVLRLLPANMLKWDMEGIISGILSGTLEITAGTGAVSRCAAAPLFIKLPAVSFIIGWAGLSVHLQVMSIVSGTDINIRPYLLGKLLHGAAGAVYAWVGSKLIPLGNMAVQPALGLPGFEMQSFFESMWRSIWTLVLVIAALVGTISVLRFHEARKKKSST
jgi:sporulation integral membrane protein YlbJ